MTSYSFSREGNRSSENVSNFLKKFEVQCLQVKESLKKRISMPWFSQKKKGILVSKVVELV